MNKYAPVLCLAMVGLGLFAARTFAKEPSSDAAPVVRIESGQIRGANADGVISFKGIPFAAAPLKTLRWRPPQPVTPWSDVRDATQCAHDSMQLPFPSDAAPLGRTPDEDSLYLNVWYPAKPSSTPLPVMVWIYGGALTNGGSSPAVYDGTEFAKQGVVFVSFNYRLGRFGFFGHPALTKEHPEEAKVNYGHMDQIAALQWVQRNIAAFGGDPHQVTIFGESAGGASVNLLLTSPQGKGLFQRAIIQSGGGRNLLMAPDVAFAESRGLAFAKKMGIEGKDTSAAERLRALSPEQVVDGMNLINMRDARETYSGPVIDGKVAVMSAEEAYRLGKFAQVPVMVGATSAEVGAFPAKTLEEAFALFGADKDKAKRLYDPQGLGDFAGICREMGRDAMMVEPARFVARTFSGAGQPAYYYRFSYVADAMVADLKVHPDPGQMGGAPHASEIPYAFDTLPARYGKSVTPRDAKMAAAMHAYWVNFAKTGNPNGDGLPAWPTYQKGKETIMDFAADGTPTSKKDPLCERLDLIEKVAEKH